MSCHVVVMTTRGGPSLFGLLTKELAKRSLVLGPGIASIERMRDLLNRTAEIAARYLETLDERGVAPTPEALARLAELNQPLQDDPQDPHLRP